MNNILQLKGQFEQQRARNAVAVRNLPRNQQVEASHISDLINSLNNVLH